MEKKATYTGKAIGLAAILAVVVLLVLTISTGWFMSSSQDATENAVHNISEFYLEELSDQAGRQLQNSLDQTARDLDTALHVLQKGDLADRPSLQHYIANMSQVYGFDFFALVDAEGTAYTADSVFPGRSRLSFLSKTDLTGPDISVEQPEGDQDMITIAVPIGDLPFDRTTLIGGVVGIDTSTLSERLALKNDENLIFSNVILGDGSYIVKTPHYHLEDNENIFSALEEQAIFQDGSSVEKMRADIQAGRSGTIAYHLKNSMHYTYYAPAEGTCWYLTTTIHYETVSTNVEIVRATITRNSMIQLGLVLLVLSAVFFVYFGQRRKNEILHLEKIKAEESSKAKSLFLSNMSHDIRTPMNAITGFTDLAIQHEGDIDTPRIHDYLVKIRTASSHLLNLINDVLDMSRIESGKIQLDIVPCDLYSILQGMETILQGQIQEKGQTLTIKTVDVADSYVCCDKLRLNQVLLNLLGNAVKFTPPKGTILLSLSQKSCPRTGYAAYRFCVKDNGIGMSKDFAKKVFEPFERERTSTVSGIQGTGLGMAITKNIIDLMGGSISVETALGEGTTFTIDLELALCSRDQLAGGLGGSQADDQDGPDFKGKRILLVEDNELNREIATEILLQYGFEVEEAEDGSIAVEMIRQAQPGRYDLILMDIQMPVMDGYAATRQIRSMSGSAYATIPIIAMTANAFEEDKRTAMENGMDGHIAKPVDVDLLVQILSQILKR